MAVACLNVGVLVKGIEVIHSVTFEIANSAADFVWGCTFQIYVPVDVIIEKKHVFGVKKKKKKRDKDEFK